MEIQIWESLVYTVELFKVMECIKSLSKILNWYWFRVGEQFGN